MAYESKFNSNEVEGILDDSARNTGSNSVTSLTNLPVNKRLVKASLSRSTNISLSGTMEIGQELYIVVTPSATFTQAIPSSGSWVCVGESPISVTNGKRTEISILCTGNNEYSISARSEE